mgnify:CR=1 FL=1
MDIIGVSNVCLTLGKTEILKHINVSFEKGKIHGLIGRNGSGKTMLMKCICGFIKPTSGEIIVDGKQVGMPFPPSPASSPGPGSRQRYCRHCIFSSD